MTHADEPKVGRRNPSCLFLRTSTLDGGGDRRGGDLF